MTHQPASLNPTGRFSDRVEHYVRARPSYPPQVIELLQRACGLKHHAIVADIGSGTGVLTKMLLEHGYRVLGIEPNLEMREAGESLLRHYPHFTSIPGSAEETTLEDHSVDCITAGQAFHWFDPVAARREFQRILRPGGWVALIWNNRRTAGTPFLEAYESLLQRFAVDYRQVVQQQQHRNAPPAFFAPRRCHVQRFDNAQHFDLAGLRGRLLSSSYAPQRGTPGHAEMMAALTQIFEAHQVAGRVAFAYDTQVYYGQLGAADSSRA